MNPIISFREVCKAYGPVKVLDKLNVDIAPGEKVAIIGPSGSGKSTLLRTLMTLEQPDSGDIRVSGQPLWHREVDGRRLPANQAHLHRMRAGIGMVFQQFNLFPHMTALRNVTDPQRSVLGLSKAEADERAIELLAMVGLQDKLNSYPGKLSGGQQQRVAIARALALRPRIMLFDEITSALDPELVGEVLNVLRMLAHKDDLTMLMVTHQMGFAREIADRVLFFEGGRIVEEGKPADILANPRNERTRAFMKAVLDT
jgi:polar amino acid transport system ATP-binding protein